MSVTRTPTGREVSEETLTARVMKVREVEDFRLEQTGINNYRILVLPKKDADIRGIKGSILDALVDVYGMRADYDIDINEDVCPEKNEKKYGIVNKTEEFKEYYDCKKKKEQENSGNLNNLKTFQGKLREYY